MSILLDSDTIETFRQKLESSRTFSMFIDKERQKNFDELFRVGLVKELNLTLHNQTCYFTVKIDGIYPSQEDTEVCFSLVSFHDLH